MIHDNLTMRLMSGGIFTRIVFRGFFVSFFIRRSVSFSNFLLIFANSFLFCFFTSLKTNYSAAGDRLHLVDRVLFVCRFVVPFVACDGVSCDGVSCDGVSCDGVCRVID